MAEMERGQPSLNHCRAGPRGAAWVRNHSGPDPQQPEILASVHDLAAVEWCNESTGCGERIHECETQTTS